MKTVVKPWRSEQTPALRVPARKQEPETPIRYSEEDVLDDKFVRDMGIFVPRLEDE